MRSGSRRAALTASERAVVHSYLLRHVDRLRPHASEQLELPTQRLQCQAQLGAVVGLLLAAALHLRARERHVQLQRREVARQLARAQADRVRRKLERREFAVGRAHGREPRRAQLADALRVARLLQCVCRGGKQIVVLGAVPNELIRQGGTPAAGSGARRGS